MAVNHINKASFTWAVLLGQPQKAMNKYLSTSFIYFPLLFSYQTILTLDSILDMHFAFMYIVPIIFFKCSLTLSNTNVVCLQSPVLTGRESIHTIAKNITS